MVRRDQPSARRRPATGCGVGRHSAHAAVGAAVGGGAGGGTARRLGRLAAAARAPAFARAAAPGGTCTHVHPCARAACTGAGVATRVCMHAGDARASAPLLGVPRVRELLHPSRGASQHAGGSLPQRGDAVCLARVAPRGEDVGNSPTPGPLLRAAPRALAPVALRRPLTSAPPPSLPRVASLPVGPQRPGHASLRAGLCSCATRACACSCSWDAEREREQHSWHYVQGVRRLHIAAACARRPDARSRHPMPPQVLATMRRTGAGG